MKTVRIKQTIAYDLCVPDDWNETFGEASHLQSSNYALGVWDAAMTLNAYDNGVGEVDATYPYNVESLGFKVNN